MQISHYGDFLGGMEELNGYSERLAVTITIGNPSSLRGVRERIVNKNIFFPNIIAPSFGFSDPDTLSIGKDIIIGYGYAVSCDVSIGNYNIFNADIVMVHAAEP